MSELTKFNFQTGSAFRSLSDKALLDLSAITIEQTIPPKNMVFKEGDKGDAAYIVKSGKVNVLKRNSSGADSVLVSLGKGAVIGDMAIIDDQPRSASIATIQETTFLILTKDDFRNLLADVPEISFQILKMTTERLRATNVRLKELEASTNQMEDVIRVITKIARKSNLPRSMHLLKPPASVKRGVPSRWLRPK